MAENGSQPTAADPGAVAATVELARQTQLLAAILRQGRTDLIDVAITDVQHRQLVLDQFPVAGSKRIIAYRTGAGNDNLAVPAAPAGVLALPANTARTGGTICNSGTFAVILYLCDSGSAGPRAGAPALDLPAGASWDFRLGNLLWCGNVTAVGQGGSSTLTIAEV